MRDAARNGARGGRRRRGRGALCATAALALGLAAWSGEPRDRLTRPIEIDVARASNAAVERGGEAYRLHWRLGGFLGALAGLFVPNDGEALLTFVPTTEERLEVGVLVTAPRRVGEYFVYGAEIDEGSGTTAAVWSSYMFRDSGKDREQEIDRADVIDYASAIYHLRYTPPSRVTRMTIWDGGKTYPAEVVPLEVERRKIAGRKIPVRGYEVRGVKVKGRPSFDDKFYVYFATDDNATPVEIVGKRGWIRVSIELVEAPEASAQARGGAG